MRVRAKKLAPVRKGQTPKPEALEYPFPAPTRGLILNEPLTRPQPGGARILDNWICDLSTIRVRKGYLKHATVTDPATELFNYKDGSTEKLFATTADSIYDITSPADPDVAPTADVSAQTSGDYSHEQFGTAGGQYLYAVNGADEAQLFDGSSWTQINGASSPAITGVTTDKFRHVWSFANRLFFIGDDMDVWYLPVDSLGGAANKFSLAGVMKKGGRLLFGATWSLDSGDGLDDKWIVVSTEGEVAIYEGTNPGSAADWSKVGVYQIGRPLGRNATMQAGGDLLIATEIGLVPVSEAIRKDVAALSLGAVSRRIEPYWQTRAKGFSAQPWKIEKWPAENIMVVSQPETVTTLGTALIANLQTGAWSRFTGTDTRSIGYYGGDVYFGSNDGTVHKMQAAGSDNGMPYTAACLWQHDQMDLPDRQKTVAQMRPVFRSGTDIRPQIRALSNYSETLTSAPNAAADSATEGWDLSTWDSSNWDASAGGGVNPEDSQWTAVGVTGHAIAPELQITFGGQTPPDAELIAISSTFWPGALVA